jgi:putative protein kinase ArgK-like GTPase of G3E family
MTEKPNSNGKQTLLWANTVLTTVCLAGGGFMGTRLWDKVDRTSDKVDLNGLTMTRIEERQNAVLREIPELKQADKSISEKVEQSNKSISDRIDALERKARP